MEDLRRYISVATVVYRDKTGGTPMYSAAIFGMAPSPELVPEVKQYIKDRIVLVGSRTDGLAIQSEIDKLTKEVSQRFNMECHGIVVDAILEVKYREREAGDAK